MDLKSWREKRIEGEQFDLQSGLSVRLRRCDLMDLAVLGNVPTPLVDEVDMLLSNTKTELKVEDFPRFAPVINLVVKACMIEPEIADQADETHLGIDELPMLDRFAIYNWAIRGLQPLVPFRDRQRGAARHAEPAVQREAE
jgi:hypothetical protein